MGRWEWVRHYFVWVGVDGNEWGIGVVAVLDNAHVHFFDTFSPLSSK